MNRSEVNPYQAPIAESENAETRFSGMASRGSPVIALVSAIGGMIFVALIIVLLTSSPPDQKAGMLMLANVPFVIGMVVSCFRSTRICSYLAFSGAGMQVVIAVAMLMFLGSGVDVPAVLGINSIIISCWLAIAVWARVSSRRNDPSVQA